MLQLENFLSVINTKISLVNEVNNLYGKTLANQFNSLDFWQVGENKVSEILAFFLDPKSAHNHGDLYLKLFTNCLGLEFSYTASEKIEVMVEKRTDSNRRIDIFINYDNGKKIIGIENKIYEHTADQKNQVADYITYLRSVARESYCLIYLAPKNKSLGSHSIDKTLSEQFQNSGNLRLINYEDHLVDIIHEFAIHTENERVRSFLLDFEKKLRKNYMGEQSINESKAVADYIKESDQNISLAFRVSSAIGQVKKDLKLSLLDQLSDLADELKIKFDRKTQCFEFASLPDHFVAVSYEMGGILYGIKRVYEDKGKARFPELERLYHEDFQTSFWWAMYRLLYQNIEVESEFWTDIKNGVVKEKLKCFISTIIKEYNPVSDSSAV